MPEEKDQLTVEEEEDLIRVQWEEVHESPAVKEQIARVLREAYREKFGTDPEPGSSKRPSRSHKDPVDELDDLPSSELDELEEVWSKHRDHLWRPGSPKGQWKTRKGTTGEREAWYRDDRQGES